MQPQGSFTLTLPESRSFSSDEFFELCGANPELILERDKTGKIIIRPLHETILGYYTAILSSEISKWNLIAKAGVVFGSSAGFTLPDGSVKSPDCAWVSKEKWNELTLTLKQKFAPVCPEFVVEIMSPTDSIDQLKSNMTEWMTNGVKLGWLVDVDAETVLVFRANESISIVTPFNQSLSGGEVLPGLEFDVSLLLEE